MLANQSFNKSERDPRTAPKTGDIIRQYCGDHVRVTAIDGEKISFDWKRAGKGEWRQPNGWTLSGWRNIVCDRSTVVHAS